MIDSTLFAKYIILRSQKINNEISNNDSSHIKLNETKLHKIMYICDGIMLSSGFNIINEHARAWNYGPVYPKVHKLVCKNKNIFDQTPEIESKDIKLLDSMGIGDLVDKALNTFGKRTAGQLSTWSHSPGSPWEIALKKNKGIMNGVIDKEEMRLYFSGFGNGR